MQNIVPFSRCLVPYTPRCVAILGSKFRALHSCFLAKFQKRYGEIRGIFYDPAYQKMFLEGEKPELFLPSGQWRLYQEFGRSFLDFERRFADAMFDLVTSISIVDPGEWILVEEVMQTKVVARKRGFRLPIVRSYSAELIWRKLPTSHGYTHLAEKYVEFFAIRVVSPFGCCIFPDFVVSALFTLDARPERDWLLRHLDLRAHQGAQRLLIELIKSVNTTKEQEFIRRRAAA